MDRVAVFLDGGYVAKLTKEVFTDGNGSPMRVDFAAFARQLAHERGGDLLRCYYYHCPPYQSQYPSDDERLRQRNYDRFVYSLRQLKQLQLREGRLRRTFDAQGEAAFLQKGVDVLLAIDMVKLAMKGAIQQAILVASDADFVPAVRALKEEGVMTHIYYFDDRSIGCSRELVMECDDRHELHKEHFSSCQIT